MNRLGVLGAACVALAILCEAQIVRPATQQTERNAAGRAAPRFGRRVILSGEAKLRYVVKQLDVNAEQRNYVEALLEVYRDEEEDARQAMIANIGRLQAVAKDYADAKRAGDTDKAAEYERQMRELTTPTERAEAEFFDNLNSVLNEEQKKTLQEWRERLAKDPDVSLRAQQVVDVAAKLSLDPEQKTNLERIVRDFREKNGRMVGGDPMNIPHEALVNLLISQVREILTPEQVKHFERGLARLRPDSPATRPAGPTATQPAGEHEDASDESEE